MLISFPVAFWTGALATDGAGAVTNDLFWFRMSVVLVAMGTATGALASVFGYIDYRTIRMTSAARRVANAHLNGSLITIVIFCAALALRLHDFRSTVGIAITVAGTLGLLIAGFYGSELSNKHGIGVLGAPPQ